MKLRTPLTLLLLLLTLAACASGGGRGSRDSDRISPEELREVQSSIGDMYEVVQRLRPLWLRSRGSSLAAGRYLPVVYVSGARFGGVDSLRSLRPTEVAEVRYMDPSEATTRYGTGHPGGIILITMR